ncbi:MAG: hypothetical protein EA376_11780 [Phycisphaeraceae bacterium]|nr:MAG: hypothetical protein EA376_11780 [Phycisphaeraceae bacterium]
MQEISLQARLRREWLLVAHAIAAILIVLITVARLVEVADPTRLLSLSSVIFLMLLVFAMALPYLLNGVLCRFIVKRYRGAHGIPGLVGLVWCMLVSVYALSFDYTTDALSVLTLLIVPIVIGAPGAVIGSGMSYTGVFLILRWRRSKKPCMEGDA